MIRPLLWKQSCKHNYKSSFLLFIYWQISSLLNNWVWQVGLAIWSGINLMTPGPNTCLLLFSLAFTTKTIPKLLLRSVNLLWKVWYLRSNHAHELLLMVYLVWQCLLWLPEAESCSWTTLMVYFIGHCLVLLTETKSCPWTPTHLTVFALVTWGGFMLMNSYSWFIWLSFDYSGYPKRNHAHELLFMVYFWIKHCFLWIPDTKSCSWTPTHGLFGLAFVCISYLRRNHAH